MLGQRQVVLCGTTVVAIAFNLHLPALLLDELCSLGQSLASIGTKVSLVIVEINVLHHLGKELIVRDWIRSWRRGWSRRCLRRHRNLRCGFLCSRCAFRGQMICGGLRRRDGLRTAGI